MLRGVPGDAVWPRGQTIAQLASQVRADILFAIVDVFIVVTSYSVGLGLRMLDPLVQETQPFWLDLAMAMPVIVLVHVVANVVAGAYGHVWEYASTSEATRVALANAAAVALVFVLSWLARTEIAVLLPYSVVVVGGLLSLLGMGLVRFRSRLFYSRKHGDGSRILIVGSGIEAATFARRAGIIDGGRRVIGFLTDQIEQVGSVRRLAGLPILGSIDDVADKVRQLDIDEVVVVGSDPVRSRRVVDLCLDVDVRLRILPAAEDVMSSNKASLDVRDISVQDLLVRPPIATDLDAVSELLQGKSVLVTGAGGSIGSEIVRQILEFDPSVVYALDRDETLLHEASLQWSRPVQTFLSDVREADKILRLFEKLQPQMVFHAAALKHVPMLERHPEEAVLTNVAGTLNIIEAGSRNGMGHFVLISTDKAVDPVSVMGASKRAAELLTQTGGTRADGCVYTAVRFGNVLGSRGSVIPTFVRQIKNGGPVTVTDRDMERYFMTVDEAVELVLQAVTLAKRDEVFLLDMGDPVRIEDLARRLIRLAGLAPDKDIALNFTGRRPGEKLTEVLSSGPLQHTANPKIFEAHLIQPDAGQVVAAVTELEEAAHAGDRSRLLKILNQLTGGEVVESTDDMIVAQTH